MKSHILSSFLPFFRAKQGNVAMIFALALVPSILALSVALTYIRTTDAKSKDQSGLDAAVLAAVNQPDQASAIAEFNKFVAANLRPGTVLAAPVYNVASDGTVTFSASGTGSVAGVFSGVTQLTSMTYHVNATAQTQPAPISLAFTPTGAQGWFYKQVTLWVHRQGAAADTQLASYTYQPTQLHVNSPYGAAGIGTLTSNPAGTVALGNYDRLYLKMQVHNDPCPLGQTWAITNADPVQCAPGGTNSFDLTLRSDDPATAYYLFVNGVQLAQGAAARIDTLLPCNQSFTHAWEDGGNFSVQDFYFNVVSTCGIGSVGPHLVR